VLLRAAAHEPPDAALIDQIEQLLGLATSDTLRYHDRRLGQRRSVRLVRDGESTTVQGFVLAGDSRAEAWIRPVLQDELPAGGYGRLLLMPGANAPVAVVAKGRQVCACFNVTEPAITLQLQGSAGSEDQRLASLQGALKCGTNCGSCVPELRRLVRATPATATVTATVVI